MKADPPPQGGGAERYDLNVWLRRHLALRLLEGDGLVDEVRVG